MHALDELARAQGRTPTRLDGTPFDLLDDRLDGE